MKKRLLLALMAAFVTSFSMAQKGLSTWYEFKFSKEITKKLSWEVKPEYRLTPDFTRDEYFLETGLEYELFDFLKLAGFYRYYDENKKKNDEIGHKYFFEVMPELDVQRFEIQGRIRYINNFISKSVERTNPYLRYRLKAKYNIQKSELEPYAHIELYHDLKGHEVNRVRYTIGATYDFNKTHAIELFYRLQNYWTKNEVMNIIGVGYSLKI
ncbi:MAG TPA: DUF2490 domain-containing protein [Sunxiuqinia sp.]|nr:DUF2490 domain-containing protein [Sunxiuqinia sp.]